VLTIAISVASGVDALFSLLPSVSQVIKLEVEVICGLIYLNLRGMRESIRILAPIFIGFVITHFVLIARGTFDAPEQRVLREPPGIRD
jgi:hypothetical protein